MQSVELFKLSSKQQWIYVGTNITDKNGRITNFLDSSNKNQGTYKLVFQTGKYFTACKQNTVFPYVEMVFTTPDTQHYHIPITIAGNRYSTYRSS
ncbi:5-hydroxyisourate hydrolase [Brevinema andersonii]|uniref:5-hydroxyisourate hydrolase n=1 Tax=Brevinema andersonii TaxID=34097 RepID=A0A1I1EMF0_BREAD|nr:hydroxyisourate hydrolase [Brevinema andersonii]SFB87832.1 5-hydroxyisourate hydrolase [Brevinema andersonii]